MAVGGVQGPDAVLHKLLYPAALALQLPLKSMARSRQYSHRLTSRPLPPTGMSRRTKLTVEEAQELSSKMREIFGWDAEPKPFQLAGVTAQIEGNDMIIQAPTGAGKTAIAAGPHLWKSSAGKTTIMVCPLLSLEEEMVRTFWLDFGLNAIAVNSQNGACSSAIIKKILSGVYHIVLISPEMLQSRTFINRVLRDSRFSRRVLSVVVDEAHCIHQEKLPTLISTQLVLSVNYGKYLYCRKCSNVKEACRRLYNIYWMPKTTWTWTGGTGVKSFTNVQLNQGINKQLSAISSMPSTWKWSQSTSGTIVADIAYDLFTSNTAGGSNVNEIMIWLANFNAGPISSQYGSDGKPVPVASNLSIAGHTG
ncbi:hypothetical protein NUW54_g9487 [Trametes sanguinea]|uniref:Uncharacterized protein n=1 Tax=Trametes sanguinea TaxID=158606 RepID=A0ACC1P6R0_9APHY|nr:hypothetical protein NUW54_g9487 [Trametes sanguinea]